MYTADPSKTDNANHIDQVHSITSDIEKMAGSTSNDDGSGGMITKIEAARIAMQAGCRLVISDGRIKRPLHSIDEGVRCTWFVAEAEPMTARKRWIAGSLNPVGTVYIDPGAAKALVSGSSLLPAGVVRVEGNFDRGDPVIISNDKGIEMARGLSAYSSDDVNRIRGLKSNQTEEVLGYRGREEIIHRDDLIISKL